MPAARSVLGWASGPSGQVFLWELVASVALFLSFWPAMTWLYVAGSKSQTWHGQYWPWLWHAGGMVVFDMALPGTWVNPSLVVGSWVVGAIKTKEAQLRVAAELIAALFAWRLMKDWVGLPGWLSSHPGMSGPAVSQPLKTADAALYECLLTAVLSIVLTLIGKFFAQAAMLRRVLTAIVVRVLIQVGGRLGTGGCMNALVSLAWIFYSPSLALNKSSNLLDYQLIYVLSPVVGAVAGSVTVDLALQVAKSLATVGGTKSSNSKKRR